MKSFELKYERAKEHLEELEGEVKKYLESNPFQVYNFDEPKTGDLIVKLNIIHQPPAKLGVIIGDILHNLRSSLDLLISELLISNGNVPSRDSCFPIYLLEKDFNRDGIRRLEGVSSKAVEIIKNIKPYKAESLRLWQLHQLDIKDKHQLIIPFGSAHNKIIIDFSFGFKQLDPKMDVPPMPLGLIPADNQFPLKDGAELFEVPKAHRGKIDPSPQFSFELAFGEGNIIQGEEILSTIKDFFIVVEDIINQAKPILKN